MLPLVFRIINKQNKYPVLLLTQGVNSKYEDFMDPRTWSIRNGVWFAEMSGLLGRDIYHAPYLVSVYY